MVTGSPLKWNGQASMEARKLSSIFSPAAGTVDGINSTNSSPPNRAMKSVPRSRLRNTLAMIFSTLSPARCP
ncbi:hypothetical protein D3C77_805980 [compost metagenome]